MSVQLDHLVVTAPELEAGVGAVEHALGVTMTPGGKHPVMGTHNALLRLGPDTYLEVIAPDPSASRPPHPRWFELDQLKADEPPRLAGWVARCDDIHVTAEACGEAVGAVQAMTRDTLDWQITIRPDGGLPMGGGVPSLIEWGDTPHPASALPDVGCALTDLTVFHPNPEWVHGLFLAMVLQSRPRVHWSGEEAPRLEAVLDTPDGSRVLSSAALAG